MSQKNAELSQCDMIKFFFTIFFHMAVWNLYFCVGEIFFYMHAYTSLLQDLDAIRKSIVVRNFKKNIIMPQSEICEIIAHSPAPRLYVTPERARRLLAGFPNCQASGSNNAMYQELYKRYSELPPEKRNFLNLPAIIFQPAPSFYLSPLYIKKLLIKVYGKNNKRKQKEA